MSIRPLEISLPAPPSKAAARQNGEPQAAPVARSQRGASAAVGAGSGPAVIAPDPAIALALESDEHRSARADPARDEAGQRSSRQDLLEAVESAQRIVEAQVRDISFSVHDKTGELVVRIIDRESKEVIRQIPAEEMLRIAEQILALQGENQPGLLLTQKA